MTYQDVSPLCCPVSMFFWTGWGVVTSYRIMILLVEVQSQIFLLQVAGERAHSDLKWRSVVLKLRSTLGNTRSTVVVFDGATKCFAEIESSYFCHDETRVQVLNTAQFAEVYFIFKFLKNLVTLAFCTLFEILEERFRSGLPKTWHQL